MVSRALPQLMLSEIIPSIHGKTVASLDFDLLWAFRIRNNRLPAAGIRMYNPDLSLHLPVAVDVEATATISASVNCLGRAFLLAIDVKREIKPTVMKVRLNVQKISVGKNLPRRRLVFDCAILGRVWSRLVYVTHWILLAQIRRLARRNIDCAGSHVKIFVWSTRHGQVLVLQLDIELLLLVFIVDDLGKRVEGVFGVDPESALDFLRATVVMHTPCVFTLSDKNRNGGH
jgi:hypothetical protein